MAVVETGYKPAYGSPYNELWTRDHAYTVWHDNELLTVAQLNQFVTHRLAKRSTTVTGGGYADFIADRINAVGTVTYKNPGASERPFMDGIHFVVMVLHTAWKRDGSKTTFTANKSAIDACLAAIPRSANGCVYSDPGKPSVDYGFTDTIKKTGDVAYGTALQAWAYKMLAEINGENGSGEYTTKFNEASAGLATLRMSNGWYRGSSANNNNRYDVWATALAVAEELITSPEERVASALTLTRAYVSNTLSQSGWFRHLPKDQYWEGTVTAPETYQNGGYWLTPLWDIYRTIKIVAPIIAEQIKTLAMREVNREIQVEPGLGEYTAPYEWYNGATLSTPKGYTASAAIVKRFI